jgi:hypothetical protein|tara:strand:+ start:1574 stop:1684 length:111 start_codon:yes stop_codon:yes gene_type:complete
MKNKLLATAAIAALTFSVFSPAYAGGTDYKEMPAGV